ncbi:MAG TPA: Xaa-Pro peptidase family protein [Candidatus Omnitrophota bacterium]|nr:Xaa-Pro peptidase family protein [Candidatus Omnitrophota bacterium]HQL40869.1 Xaa-Pro peptidase family protein [Candidatus Omnitrophota bacterium]
MNASLQKLRLSFAKYSIDAFLVTDDVNIRYLTGYPCQESWLLILPRHVYYLTDSRYSLDARRHFGRINVVECKKSAFDSVADLVSKRKVHSLGFDERHLVVVSFRRLKKALTRKVRLIGTQGLIENIRAVKRENEVAAIRKALCFHNECYQYLKTIIRPGQAEHQILEKLERFVLRHQQIFSFPPIIASGPNSCLPHARISDRKIKKNDLVLVDMGIEVNGYKSDLTRMFFLGKIPHLVREVCEAVAQAQRLAIAQIKPGVLAKDVDSCARNFLKEKKLGAYFSHSLGHGIGLEVHEKPGLSPRSPSVLEKGMVLTVEPGVYIPGRFGVRIEDMVLVTSQGAKVLSGLI